MLKLATDAPLGTGKVNSASTGRFSVLWKTCVTLVTATPLFIVTCTSCSFTSSTPPKPPAAMSKPAAGEQSGTRQVQSANAARGRDMCFLALASLDLNELFFIYCPEHKSYARPRKFYLTNL